jgi:coenzyme F420-reducing hydrogenase alpha subunit
MGKLTIQVDDKLEEKFRAAVASVKGYHKGALGKAVEEALALWIAEHEKKQNTK